MVIRQGRGFPVSDLGHRHVERSRPTPRAWASRRGSTRSITMSSGVPGDAIKSVFAPARSVPRGTATVCQSGSSIGSSRPTSTAVQANGPVELDVGLADQQRGLARVARAAKRSLRLAALRLAPWRTRPTRADRRFPGDAAHRPGPLGPVASQCLWSGEREEHAPVERLPRVAGTDGSAVGREVERRRTREYPRRRRLKSQL